MSMELGKQTFSHEREYFIAGTTIRITTAVKTAAEALEAHTPVIIDGDKVKPLTAPTGDNAVDTTGLYGITVEAFDKNTDAVVYLTGEFFGEDLALPAGVTAADVELAFRNIGIFLK